MWRFLTSLAAAALILIPSASAKELRPGDLRLCGATRCRTIENRAVLRQFSTFFYFGHEPERVGRPAAGSPAYELRFFRSRFVGAVISGNAIRVNGVNCGRFRAGWWYRLPTGLQALTAGLTPRRLTTAAPRSC